jgi:hypothetical protein
MRRDTTSQYGSSAKTVPHCKGFTHTKSRRFLKHYRDWTYSQVTVKELSEESFSLAQTSQKREIFDFFVLVYGNVAVELRRVGGYPDRT